MTDTATYVILIYGKPEPTQEYVDSLPTEVIKNSIKKAFGFHSASNGSRHLRDLLMSLMLSRSGLEKVSPVLTELLIAHHDRQRRN